MSPQTPLFSPITREVRGYRQNTSNATRPLMYPEEIQQMDNSECLILVRGRKPVKAKKITPLELSAYKKLKHKRVTDYVPVWRYNEENGVVDDSDIYSDMYDDEFEMDSEYTAQNRIPSIEKLKTMTSVYDAAEYREDTDHKQCRTDDIAAASKKSVIERFTR